MGPSAAGNAPRVPGFLDWVPDNSAEHAHTKLRTNGKDFTMPGKNADYKAQLIAEGGQARWDCWWRPPSSA